MSEFGTYYLNVMEKIRERVEEIVEFKDVTKGFKQEVKQYPSAFVIEGRVDLDPATSNKTDHDMTYTVLIVDLKNSQWGGLSSVLNLAGKVKDKLESDRSLDSLVYNLEVLRYDPHWEMERSHFRYYCAVILVCKSLR